MAKAELSGDEDGDPLGGNELAMVADEPSETKAGETRATSESGHKVDHSPPSSPPHCNAELPQVPLGGNEIAKCLGELAGDADDEIEADVPDPSETRDTSSVEDFKAFLLDFCCASCLAEATGVKARRARQVARRMVVTAVCDVPATNKTLIEFFWKAGTTLHCAALDKTEMDEQLLKLYDPALEQRSARMFGEALWRTS